MRMLLFLFLACLAYGQNIDEDKLGQALETKCNTNAQNTNAFVVFKQSIVDFRECVRSKFETELPNSVEDHKDFCDYLRTSGLYGCAEDFTQGVAPCLDDSEKYLQHLLLHAVNSTYDELCGPHGVANSNLIFNQINSKKGCSGLSASAWSEWGCLSELDILKDLDNGVVNFNKHDVCLNLNKLQSCMKSVAERRCPNDQYTQIMDLIFTPFTEECNDLVLQN